MTDRERFLAILGYEQPDEALLIQWMGFSDGALARWRGEGMPADTCPHRYFGLSQVRTLPVSVHPYPARDDIMVEEGDGYRVVLDNRGLTALHDDRAPHFPKYLDHPVKSREDWGRYKTRINAGCQERYDALRETAPDYRNSQEPVVLGLRGCFELKYFLGMTEALCMLHDDPGFVRDMLEFWFAHQWDVLDEACALVVPDAVCIWEDLAYKNGPFVSPRMYDDFFAPYHRETASRVAAHGIRHLLVDCDGDIDDLLPRFIANGITGTYPLECQSGADPVKFRERYGRTVQLVGGIDKRALFGSHDEIISEIDRKVPRLTSEGGFLPSLDHAVPPEVSLDNFRFFVTYLRHIWNAALS